MTGPTVALSRYWISRQAFHQISPLIPHQRAAPAVSTLGRGGIGLQDRTRRNITVCKVPRQRIEPTQGAPQRPTDRRTYRTESWKHPTRQGSHNQFAASLPVQGRRHSTSTDPGHKQRHDTGPSTEHRITQIAESKPPTMSEPVEVLLYGLGAIGSFYAFILQNNSRVRLSVCARSNYDAVKQNGVTIRSMNHGEHNFKPAKILRSPEEAQQKYDYIVCVNKAVNTESVLAQLAPVVGEKTTIALMQNGVGNEDPFREAFPQCTILSGVIWVGATQHTPGVVDHTSSEDTELGLFPNLKLDASLEEQRLQGLASLLRDGGTNVQVLPNIQTARWKKVIWNMAWNSLTTLTGADTESWLKSSELSTPITHRLMTEAIEVARALEVPGIEYELADELIAKVKPLGALYSSMYHDSRAARPMEVEVILGNAVRKGRALGLAIPTLETLYAVLLAVDQTLAKARASK